MGEYSILDKRSKLQIERPSDFSEPYKSQHTWGKFKWRWYVQGRCGDGCTKCNKKFKPSKSEYYFQTGNIANFHYHVKEGCYCKEKCLPSKYAKFKTIKFKCASGKPPCSLGETDMDCHLFHCSFASSGSRDEADSCEHPCAVCNKPLKHEGSILNNHVLKERGLDLKHNQAHNKCWEEVNFNPQLSLEVYF